MAMHLPLQDRLKSAPAATERLAMALFREMGPKILFFFSAFALIFVLFKLFVAQYSIEFSAFTKAAIAALILGKVIPLLDWTQSGHRFETHRRIVVIGSKTLIYGLVVILLGIGDRLFEDFSKEGSLSAAVNLFVANANVQRFLGLVLLISLVIFIYLI